MKRLVLYPAIMREINLRRNRGESAGTIKTWLISLAENKIKEKTAIAA